MVEVRRKEPAARLVVVGEGPERSRLEDLVRRHGISEQVSFPGALDDPWSILAGVDVFVLPSVKEGLPFALVEAMAVGVPIVTTRVGGIPEVVRDGRSAQLVPPGDPAALSEAITSLLQDRRLAAMLGQEAKQDVLRRGLTAEAMAARTASLYRELLAAKSVH
jgi:glycosyltransferase involved in cell wall biosynthesis